MVACGSQPAETSWQLIGDGELPAGFAAALATAGNRHLRQLKIMDDLGDGSARAGVVRHPGVPPEAVVEALGYARDDLPPALRRQAGSWRLVLSTVGSAGPVEIGLVAQGP
jgi:hypothetical protein